MRRVLLFAAFLLLLGLTTATAASFDVQAEDVTSFSTPVSISVPTSLPPAFGTFYMVDAPANATLVQVEPTSTGGNEKASFDFGISNIKTEERPLETGDKAYYVSWRSAPISTGMSFLNTTLRVLFTRTGASGGQLRVGVFSCDPNAFLPTVDATVDGKNCRFLAEGLGGGETIDIVVSNAQVDPGDELRLKMVSASLASSSIQWGYKANNRSARLEVLAP